jgi:ABC-type antimicrobial peptide transport system permease subunit
MSETFFPVNDLLRRKLQTSLTIITLTLSIASTLFLLLFSERIGFGIASMTEETLTYGLSAIFSQFLLFIGILIFAVGAVITSFIVFLMMKQRTQDFGLIKAAGCPNSLVFGYFMTELLIVTFAGCILGAVLGFVADFAVANVFQFQTYQNPPALWLALLVFGVFFVLALIFGAKPILDSARLSPMKALSPVQYFGLSTGSKLKPLSRFGITLRIASRSLFRRQAASVRIIILLSIVFVLLTVSICGGIVANGTTTSWIENAVGKDIILIAHNSMATQYELLLSKFFGAAENTDFDYLDERLAVPDSILQHLKVTPEISSIDARLILKETVQEMRGYKIDPETLVTISVGGNRTGNSLVVGVEPEKMLTKGFTKGQALNSSGARAAVIGDTLAQTMYSPDLSANPPISVADPLLQNVIVRGKIFKITGICIDPINSGNVTYVSLENLQNATSISYVNVVFVKLGSSVDRAATLAQLREKIQSINSEFTVFELKVVLQENVAFLGSFWSTILLLPLFTLTSAALCLIGYIMLAVNEQRQEFAILRAIGAKPKAIVAILAVQSMIVLLSSWAVGISLGVITALMILVPNPVVASVSILEIAAWLFAALGGMFLLSLVPAARFAKTPLLKIMT